MIFSPAELGAIWLTIKLATTVTCLLIVFGTPLAWWLARTQHWLRTPINALVALPLILPPTVLGFYLVLALGPNGPIGELSTTLGLGLLPFTFWGLVIGSLIYSLPFVVQPLQNAFASIGERPLEVAAMMGAGRWDRFFTVALPLAKQGYITALVMGFAHTIGEFGVVLMIGGNIPETTQVLSILLFDEVEALNYDAAHRLAATMLVFSFVTLTLLYSRTNKQVLTWGRT